jgi:hypothetical protein
LGSLLGLVWKQPNARKPVPPICGRGIFDSQENCYDLIVSTGVFAHEYQSDSRTGTDRQRQAEVRSLSICGGSDCQGPRCSSGKEGSSLADDNGHHDDAVREMLNFVEKNRTPLHGISVKQLIHEGHRL